ncbi:MAG: SMC-Scp complex subunit ScpB [Oscillospiraceae bacterium]|jgi:segregation and condensation protein B|nr:SMC-Scp complex subunit ScpB [Oscillospiraceae bacterium]
MDNNYYRSALEAVLFAVAEPVSAQKLADALSIETGTVLNLLAEISQDLDSRDSGLCLLRFEDRYQLSTRPKFADFVVRALDNRRNAPLSQAAMEVLSIIAYNQPVSRAFIDEIRGVDSSSALGTLISRNLVEEAGRLDLPGRPVSFVTTDNFLRCFNLTSLEDLPPLHGETLLDAPQEEEYEELTFE